MWLYRFTEYQGVWTVTEIRLKINKCNAIRGEKSKILEWKFIEPESKSKQTTMPEIAQNKLGNILQTYISPLLSTGLEVSIGIREG